MYCQCLSSEQTSNYVPLTLFKKQQMIETRPRHYCNSCTSPNRRSSWVHWGDTFTHSWSRQSGQVEIIKDKYWEPILLLMRHSFHPWWIMDIILHYLTIEILLNIIFHHVFHLQNFRLPKGSVTVTRHLFKKIKVSLVNWKSFSNEDDDIACIGTSTGSCQCCMLGKHLDIIKV